jgi:hypothetical protein
VAFGIVGNGFGQLGDEERPLGAGSNKAHIAAQHVQDLREFINAKFSDNRSHSRNARVTLCRPPRPPIRLGIDTHAAEFQDGKDAAVQPDPRLAVEDRPAAFELDRARGQSE